MAKEGVPQTFNITHNGKDVLKFPITNKGMNKLWDGKTARDSFERATVHMVVAVPTYIAALVVGQESLLFPVLMGYSLGNVFGFWRQSAMVNIRIGEKEGRKSKL